MSILTKRGVRLPSWKEPAASRRIEELADNPRVYIPLSYAGEGQCVLREYAAVLRGQAISQSADPNGPATPASVSGVFTGVHVLTHPLFGNLRCAALDCMVSTPEPPKEVVRPGSLSATALLDIARQAAIVDELDGSYLYEKLRRFQSEGCDLLVGDGVEAEPYASSAWAVLNEHVERVQAGLELAARVAGADRTQIAVRLPSGRRRPLQQRLGEHRLYQVGGHYPAVKYDDHPFGKTIGRIGVQALLALYRAVAFDEPHIGCVVTVAGTAVATPKNVWVPFGTTLDTLFHHCGLSAEPERLLLGDMMTGVAADSMETTVLPGVTCVLALAESPAERSGVCIGCGRCARVCHVGLLPYEIVRQAESMHYERLPALSPDDCDGCGACSYVCPAGLDLTAQVLDAQQADGTFFLNWGDDDEL